MSSTDQDELDPKSRKKLQNRAAQKKYRDRLKARITDLELRAGIADDISQALGTTARSLPEAAVPFQHGSLQRGRNSSTPAGRGGRQMLMSGAPSDEQHYGTLGSECFGGPHFERWPNHVFAQTPNLDAAFPLPTTTPTAGTASSTLTATSQCLGFDFDALSTNDANTDAPPHNCQHGHLLGLDDSFDHEALAKITSGSRSIPKVVACQPLDAPPGVPDANPSMRIQSEGQERHDQSPSLDVRITSVLEAAKAQGLGSFDAVVTAYYTGSFEVGSPLQIAQKLSRNRHLPGVLQSIRDSARQWTRWEANWYEDEIIRSAEGVLADEFNRAAGKTRGITVDDTVDPANWQTLSGTTPATTAEAGSDTVVKTRPNTVAGNPEEDLPRLWALIILLISDECATTQAKRCQLLLALVTKTARVCAQHSQAHRKDSASMRWPE